MKSNDEQIKKEKNLKEERNYQKELDEARDRASKHRNKQIVEKRYEDSDIY